MEANQAKPRHAHCTNCRNSFVYDAAEWPHGIEPEHCPICGSYGPNVETNWLVEEESAASNIKTRAQLNYINGNDPLDVYRESEGYNGVKHLESRVRTSRLAESRLEYIKKNLIAGVPPFVDPRSNPRTK